MKLVANFERDYLEISFFNLGHSMFRSFIWFNFNFIFSEIELLKACEQIEQNQK